MKRLLTIIVFMLTAVVAVNAQGSVTVSQSAEIDALVNGKKTDKKNKKDRQKVESQNEPCTSKYQDARHKTVGCPKTKRAQARDSTTRKQHFTTCQNKNSKTFSQKTATFRHGMRLKIRGL